jgi:predicted DNA binding CopG/RHH family protein
MKKTILDAEEKDILESYERGEWNPVKDTEQETRKLREYAKNTLQKDKIINIRMSSKDLEQVQVIAAQEGIPYQTLISSIIHKYVSEYLIEGVTKHSTGAKLLPHI